MQGNSRERLLILIKDRTSLQSADLFLWNRGWNLRVFHTAETLLKEMARNPVHTVFLSAEFNERQNQILPEKLKEVFGCRVVSFVEQKKLSSFSKLKLMSADVDFQILGTPSGPALERALRTLSGSYVAPAADAPKYKNRVDLSNLRKNSFWDEMKESLKEVADSVPGLRVNRLGSHQTTEGFHVRSTQGTKTFLISLPENAVRQDELLALVQAAILGAYAQRNIDIIETTSFKLKSQDVDLKLWASQNTEEHYQMILGGTEVFVVSIEIGDSVHIEKGSQHSMFRLPRTHLEALQVLDFDLYFELPSSGRLTLLIPKQTPIHPGTFAALEKHLVDDLQFQAEDRERVQRFLLEKSVSIRLQNSVTITAAA